MSNPSRIRKIMMVWVVPILVLIVILLYFLSIPVFKEIREEREVEERSALVGWGPLDDKFPQKDFDDDGVADARRVNDTLLEIRTATGWVKAEAPDYRIQRIRWEPIDGGSRRAAFLIRANNGKLYKFRESPNWVETSFWDWPVGAAYGFGKESTPHRPTRRHNQPTHPRPMSYEARLAEVTERAARIKVGMERSEVEKIFLQGDGGLSGPNRSRYYEDPEVKIEVPFDETGGRWTPLNKVIGPVRIYRGRPFTD